MTTTETARELRRSATPAERRLWHRLRHYRHIGLHFTRQCPIGPFIADFACRKHRLIIEVDGVHHDDQRQADLERTRYLEARGYTVIRFTNAEVLTQTQSVLDTVLNTMRHRHPSPCPKGRGRG